MTPLSGYIGPGAGFVFLGSFLTLVLSVLAAAASLFLWPFRMAWLAFRRRGAFRKAGVKKAIFLGLDGLDAALTERLMAEGKLPHLSALREHGGYRRLRTTFPPLSPVAWATFATGVNPARHNIFDFLNRDLRTYAPELWPAKVRAASRVLRIGGWRMPLSQPTVEARRKSEPFWKILGRNGIASTVLRVPITFPPEPFAGRLLSAMSTPDLRGTQGTFTWFSAAFPAKDSGHVEGGVRSPLRLDGSAWKGLLEGPESRKITFSIVNGDWLEIAGRRFALRVGEYTPWIRLRFGRATGIVRFLLTRREPDIALYATPVEIDPHHPALPISHPPRYAMYLAKLLGSFATLGMAEDTWALNEGAIDEESFLKQARSIQKEREAMFFSALDRTRRGVVACVFDTTDRVQHMFYKNPGVIEALYRDMDRLVGETVRYAERGVALFVLSDHGFCSFRRGVNLNAWLLRHGYLALESGLEEGEDYLKGVDWERTRAYTFGLSGIYLNLRGREARGVVPPEEAHSLRKEVAARLTGLPDDDGTRAIEQAYDSRAVYQGPYIDSAPDVIVGYAPGYRASWSAALGRVTNQVFEENGKRWCGDHCVDPGAVPGVLFANLALETPDPGIEDLAPTALALFGVARPSWMEGRPVVAAA